MSDAKPPDCFEPPPISDEVRARMHFWDRFFQSINKFTYAGLWIGVAYFAYLSVNALAGEATLVDVSLLYTKKASSLWWAGLAGAAVMWALVERKLRRRKSRSMGDHIKQLENMIDSRRSSSGLRPDGTTNPEDK